MSQDGFNANAFHRDKEGTPRDRAGAAALPSTTGGPSPDRPFAFASSSAHVRTGVEMEPEGGPAAWGSVSAAWSPAPAEVQLQPLPSDLASMNPDSCMASGLSQMPASMVSMDSFGAFI